jgi:hypothetical protein
MRALAEWLSPPFPRNLPSQYVRWRHRFGRDHERETRLVDRYLLVVVRTHTSMDRVLELLEVVGQGVSLAIKFVVDVGSSFAREVADKLRALGAEEVTWQTARRLHWDAIFAAHVDQQLSELTELSGKLFLIPHGIGYNRKRLASTGGRPGPAGLSAHELTSFGEVFPTLIGLSSEEQRARMCEQARDRAIVIGDMVLDKLVAHEHLKPWFRESLGIGERKLVVISSTWGRSSTFSTRREIITGLLADLPSDEYAVALVLHPNVWWGESKYEIKVHLRDALDSGLLLIDHTTWQGALIAAHVVVGDHGSVTGYAVGMGLPVLIAAEGGAELDDESPLAALHAALPRISGKKPLREQVDRALNDHCPEEWKPYTDKLFELPGEGLTAAANALRGLMDLPLLTGSPRPRDAAPPVVVAGKPARSHRVVVTVTPEGVDRIERFPSILKQASDLTDSMLVICAREVDPVTRANAEVIVRADPLPDDRAQRWIAAELARTSAGVVAATTESGPVLLRFRDEQAVTARGDPFAAAVVLHSRRTHGTPLACGEFVVSAGGEVLSIAVDSVL